MHEYMFSKKGFLEDPDVAYFRSFRFLILVSSASFITKENIKSKTLIPKKKD